MNLSNLPKTTQRKKKRLGRGYSSGKGGHTVGRGTKGQKARGSRKIPLGFEGGQIPLYKRLPQIGGFRSLRIGRTVNINLRDLNVFRAGSKVTPQSLVEKKIIRRVPKGGVKILSEGKLEKNLTLSGFTYSKTAKEKIEKSGSKINA
ncbi:50S ribosomal protein L15 [Patescibacteria group bacterium]